MKNNYGRFLLMLAVSFVIMYTVMYLNVDRFDHVYLNTTRLYMSLLMVAPMALVMLLFMGRMYENKKANLIIAFASIAVFAASLVMLRNQTFVGNEAFMHAMIPHHSSAILTSSNATLTDPELKKLSLEIIRSQEEEIAQMKRILDRLKNQEQ